MLKNVTDIAITADGWSSRAQDTFISTSGHFIDNEWRIIEVQLQTSYFPESHTGANIKEKIAAALADMCPSASPSMLVCDSASNMVKASEDLDFPRIACFAHQLQLCIKKPLEEDESIIALLTKCRSLVNHFRHSTPAAAELERMTKAQDLKTTCLVIDVVTRWNSTFDMLLRLQQIGHLANAVLRQKKRGDLALKDSDMNLIDRLVIVLAPIAGVTPLLSASRYPTLSLIYPVTFTIIDSLREQASYTHSKLAQGIVKEMESRILDVLDPTLAVATLLDPRFKSLKWLPHAHAWRETFKGHLLKSLNALPNLANPTKKRKREEIERSSIFDKLFEVEAEEMTLELELENYCKVKAKIADQDGLLPWWKGNSGEFPNLAILAKRVLAIPATSVPVERFFSAGGLIVSHKRTALSSTRVEMLMFLSANIKHC